MLPFFAEEASSPSMLHHCFDVTHTAVENANLGQTPVITVDQPLFATQLRWSMDNLYSEDKFCTASLGTSHKDDYQQSLGPLVER